MSKTLSKEKKLSVISSNCKDKRLMDDLIETYQSSTKSAVENILNMCLAVKQIDDKRKDKSINDFDVTYFCATVQLDRKSPTYRKYRKIGEHAAKFKQHMDLLPSAYTVLFQIATLDSEKFEELIESNQITPSLSLEKLKQITNTSTKTVDPDDVNFKVSFNMKTLSEESKKYLQATLMTLINSNDIELVVPDKHKPVLSFNYTLKRASEVVPTVNKNT